MPDRHVLGVDPPSSWCVWGHEGPVALGRGVPDGDSLMLLADCGFACVERPHGGAVVGTNSESLIEMGIGHGRWLERCEKWRFEYSAPRAVVWRAPYGIADLDRKSAKDFAFRLASRMLAYTLGADLLLGPRGGKDLDVAEAVLIAAYAYAATSQPTREGILREWFSDGWGMDLGTIKRLDYPSKIAQS